MKKRESLQLFTCDTQETISTNAIKAIKFRLILPLQFCIKNLVFQSFRKAATTTSIVNLKRETMLIPAEFDTWMGSPSEGLRRKNRLVELPYTFEIKNSPFKSVFCFCTAPFTEGCGVHTEAGQDALRFRVLFLHTEMVKLTN